MKKIAGFCPQLPDPGRSVRRRRHLRGPCFSLFLVVVAVVVAAVVVVVVAVAVAVVVVVVVAVFFQS